MNKVISAELKKMVSKPGIYILALVFAIILILGVLLYKPVVYEDTSIVLNGTSVTTKYADYTGNGVANAGIKAEANQLILDAQNAVNSYLYNGVNYISAINDAKTTLEQNIRDYKLLSNRSVDKSTQEKQRVKIVNNLEEINNITTSGLSLHTTYAYPIVSTKKNYDSFNEAYEEIIKLFRNEANLDISSICASYENNLKPSFYDAIYNFKFPELSSEFVANYTSGEKFSTISTRLNKINQDIYTLYVNGAPNNEENIIKIDELANKYKETANVYVNLVKYELMVNAYSTTSTAEQLDLLYLSDEAEFNAKSYLARYEYLFANDKTDAEFAHPLSIGVTSNHETNAFDYAYFTFKLFSCVIFVYGIMIACHTIAGEIKEGSMRFIAIRPVTRSKLLIGKFLSIGIMMLILTIFGAIISVAVGWSFYGITSLPILTVFNGVKVVVLSPWLMFGIFLISQLLEALIYVAIAMLLSVLFKSDLLAITIMLALYLVNMLLPVFIAGMNSWLAFYPFSHISLYSLFGSSIFAGKDILSQLLYAKVYAGTDFVTSILVIGLILLICFLISLARFKKKEL